MTHELSHLATIASTNLAAVILACAAVLGLTVWATIATKRALKDHQVADLLTFIAATLATAVAANGMWRFTGNVLHFSGPERVMFFAFLEIVVLTCAARAREHIRQALAQVRQARDRGEDPGPVGAGADGVAIWIVSAMSGVFSAWDAGSTAGAVFRLGPPLIAAWLWERGLYADMRAAGASRHWRMLADRLLVRLGLAEPDRHTVGEAAARWRLMRLARAVVRADRGGKHRRQMHRWRAGSLTVVASERAGLVTEPGRYELLLEYIGALRGVDSLIALRPPAPWDAPNVKDAPLSTPAVPAQHSRPGSAGARFPEPGSVGTPVLTEPVLGTAHGSGTGEGSHADIPENRELEPASVSGTVPSPGVRSNRSRRAPVAHALHSTDQIERTARTLADAYQAEHGRPVKVDDLQAGLTDAGMGRSRAEVARLRRQVLGLEKQQVRA